MTISGSGYNPNLFVNPSIYEKETSGQRQLQKEADIGRGNVVIVPQSQQDLVPLTHLAERNTWNYKSDANHPSLRLVGQLRGAGAEVRGGALEWEKHYLELYEELPAQVKADLEYLLPIGESLKEVLEIASKLLAWQEIAKVRAESENALQRVESNLSFPLEAFRNAFEMGNEMSKFAKKWLEILGANDPAYLGASEDLTAFTALLNEIEFGGKGRHGH